MIDYEKLCRPLPEEELNDFLLKVRGERLAREAKEHAIFEKTGMSPWTWREYNRDSQTQQQREAECDRDSHYLERLGYSK